MNSGQRVQHTIPAEFIGVERKPWLGPGTAEATLQPIAQFRLVSNVMGWNLANITDVIVTIVAEDTYGVEVAHDDGYIGPNRLAVDAVSLARFLSAWSTWK